MKWGKYTKQSKHYYKFWKYGKKTVIQKLDSAECGEIFSNFQFYKEKNWPIKNGQL